MSDIKELFKEAYFYFFKEISDIPRGSGNTKTISDYLVHFAKERGLKYEQDIYDNVIIFKDASSEEITANPVILQGHMDIVTVAEEGFEKDFLNEGLDLYIEDDFILADKTSLGADDGIAIAFALAILDSKDLVHPPLEVVITSDEEIGMLGASAIDISSLKGEVLINIDSEEDGVFCMACAGGATAKIKKEIKYAALAETFYERKEPLYLSVSGLEGGHSGMEIGKCGANAAIILGQILYRLKKEGFKFLIGDIKGGEKDNAIPIAASTYIALEDISEKDNFINSVQKLSDNFSFVYNNTDPNLRIICQNASEKKVDFFDKKTSDTLIDLLESIPNGPIRYLSDLSYMVETSLNLGKISLEDKTFILTYCTRSNVNAQKDFLLDKLEAVANAFKASIELEGAYNAWEYRKESRIKDIMLEEYKEVTGQDAKGEIIHAGLECGIFLDKKNDLDCISCGPQIYDIHTAKERLSISSTRNYWEVIKRTLRRLAKV